MRSRYAFAEVLLLCLLLFCVMAGAGNGETPQDEKMEIPIDFPFCGEEKDGRPPSLGYGETNTIHTWVGEEPEPQEEEPEPREETVAYNGYEHVRNYLEDYPSWHTEEYESREALLTDFGFGDSKPAYQYFDDNGKLKLELYMEGEQVCGLVYTDQAFTLCSIPEVEWNGGDPYVFRSVYGTTGQERENVKDYEEHIEYNAFGKPDLFVSRGRVEGWSMEDEMQDILRIEFAYREDGTLYYREYYHSHQVFMTTLRQIESYYDVHERVSFEDGYFTHGKLEYYYIYEDRDGRIADKPTYILEIDYNMGTLFARMIKCR